MPEQTDRQREIDVSVSLVKSYDVKLNDEMLGLIDALTLQQVKTACKSAESRGTNMAAYLVGTLRNMAEGPQVHDRSGHTPEPPLPETNVCNAATMRQYAIRMARDLYRAEYDEEIAKKLEAVDWVSVLPDDLIDRVCVEFGCGDRKKSSWGLHRAKVHACSWLLVHSTDALIGEADHAA